MFLRVLILFSGTSANTHFMPKKLLRVVILWISLLLLAGCTSSRNEYKRKYRKVWREIVNSQAWRDALAKQARLEDSIPFAEAPDALIPETKSGKLASLDSDFVRKYHSWVSRAYFKIIAEAEQADRKISAEYQRLATENLQEDRAGDKRFQKKLQMAKERYEAHTQMLEGLKSWKAFNEFGSDDLDFFREEYVDRAYMMYQRRPDEERIINFLMVKLADLYHIEERRLDEQ